jgi:pimeloyl-ACP methyl ester carboxylesterase
MALALGAEPEGGTMMNNRSDRILSFLRVILWLPIMGIGLAMGPTAAIAQDESPGYSTALGIAMESYAYPYPVQYLSLEIEGQQARMAYMDVRASGDSATARAVVLLHGKNFYGSYWGNTIKALTSAGFRVIIPDQIGFGKSAKPDINYSFDLLASNTARLLDHVKVEKAAIVGHSMGGMLAVRFVRNYPDRVTHLILENPIGLEDYRFKVPPQPTEKLYQNELSETDPAKIRAFYRRYVVEWKPEIYERFVEARSRIALGGEYPRWAKAAALTYQMIYQQPVRHEFGLIKAPTLLVIGQEDRTTIGRGFVSEEVLGTLGQYPQLGQAAAQDIPNARLVELERVGHIPHLEAPERFHQALLDFLK